jgi:hypothetical protein
MDQDTIRLEKMLDEVRSLEKLILRAPADLQAALCRLNALEVEFNRIKSKNN